ncbi:hypothetical protein VSR68_04260 [Paraburkholderia phymatum]|uniref:hypothetical protein n=1 Tax=Paraburkholderia phymatum TaxID=148447 RepID=UPI0031713801
MADLFDNPMQLMGFEFVAFASPTPNFDKGNSKALFASLERNQIERGTLKI